MSSLNKAIIIGNLGADPVVRYTTNNEAIANVTVACTETWTDKTTNQKKESTEWLKIVFYRKLAEIVGQYLKKGSSIYVEGKIKTRKYTDKDGSEKYITEIAADSMQMLGSSPKQDGISTKPYSKPQKQEKDTSLGKYQNDDIPF